MCMDMQVLSVKTALSIQSHPDKKLAERLHAQNPEVSNSDIHNPPQPATLGTPCFTQDSRCADTGAPELAPLHNTDHQWEQLHQLERPAYK